MNPSASNSPSPTDDWRRTEELFYAAAELPPEDRRAFLEAECADDPARVEDIEELLSAEADADQKIEGAIGGTLELAAQEGLASADGLTQVDNYRILRELGRGGMSTVYLAERADQHYRQLVALKVVKRGMDTGEILRRLRQERQILAGLEHPHISRLLDGGNTADGRPYFVIEYVDGEPIDQYCQRQNLSVEERLHLFRDVLDAVDYAHRHLIVHRDLKPGNILVTGDGQVKLLDFGIAKLLDPELAAEFGATAAAVRFFTPDYASPEQVQGRPLTTASDVYSLGVLLYELLTGRRPHDRAEGRRQLEHAICACDPEPPSDRIAATTAEARALKRRLRGDLDAIVLGALHRERRRRYVSVEQLAEDLRRHLEGLPVKARRDTLAYRTGKFLLRHRLGVAGTLIAALTLSTVVSFYTVRLASERNRAQFESRKSNQVASFLRDLFANADPGRARGPQVTARELLDQGTARIQTELTDQPEVRAELMDLMGSVYLNLGLYDDADALLETSAKFRRQHFGEDALETLTSRLHRGQWLHATGRYQESEAVFRELMGYQDTTEAHAPFVAEVMTTYADLLYDQGRPEEAEDLSRQALEIHHELYGDEHPLVATSLNDLGVALYNQGELDDAEEPLRRALAVRQRRLGANHPDLAVSLNNLGALRMAQGASDEALELMKEALAIRRRCYSPEHPSIADALNNLGEISRRSGDLKAAVAYLSEAMQIAHKVQGPDHPAYADSLANLARATQMRGELRSAIELYRQALDATRRAYGESHENVSRVLRYLGDTLVDHGDRGPAEAAYSEALELARELYPPGHWRISFPLLRLGKSRLQGGDPASSERFLREAVEIRRAERPDHWRTAEALSWLGSCRAAQGFQDEGREVLEQAFVQMRQTLGADASATLEAESRLRALSS